MPDETLAEFKLPKDLNLSDSEMQALGREIIDHVVDRTRRGLNEKGNPFPGYSEEYQNSATFKALGQDPANVDLSLSLDMLNAIEVVEIRNNAIIYGFSDSNPEQPKAEGNILGTYGQDSPIRGKARPFLGITRRERSQILNEFLGESPAARRARQSGLNDILQGVLLGVFNG